MLNNIRLSNYPDRGAAIGGVKTEINGIEMQLVRDIKLVCPVDGIATLTLEQIVGPKLDITLEGVVYPRVFLADDTLELHVEHTSPTSTRYWAVRR